MTQTPTPDPYWWDAAPRETVQPVQLPQKADVAVIGGGYAGLSAALTLARAGRHVVVFEAGAPGQGASSRSGGMIGHGHRLSYLALQQRFGKEKAFALIKEGIASFDFVVALIREEGIDARLTLSGRFRGAATKADYETMGREADALARDFAMPVAMVPKASQHQEIASEAYQGGLVFPAHGGVHPALLHHGLLALARKAGVQVFGFTPVTQITGQSGSFVLSSPAGSLMARDVVVCTNGYSQKGVPDVARRIVGIPSFLIATEPLGANRVRSLLPSGRMISETRVTHLYYRPSPDGERILLGGRAALHPIPHEDATRRLTGYLAEVFPQLGPVGITHSWRGNVAMTRSDLPGIGQRDGIWHAVGCNGSGVALMPYLGHKVALQMLGKAEGATAFDDIAIPAIPFYNGYAWFLPFMTGWYRYKDWRAGRRQTG